MNFLYLKFNIIESIRTIETELEELNISKNGFCEKVRAIYSLTHVCNAHRAVYLCFAKRCPC